MRASDQGRSTAEKLAANPQMFQTSPVLHYSLLPHFEGRHRADEFDVSIRLNSHGYRSPEFRIEKGAQFRVLCVGDSFTFGHGVEYEESWAGLLHSQLASEFSSHELEVINAGYQGCWYPDGYLLYLTRTGLRLKPDLVVVGFFVGNDLDDLPLPPRMQDHWWETDSVGLPTRIQGRDKVWRGYYTRKPPKLNSYPLLRHSRLARLLVDSVRGRSRKPTQVEISESNIYRVPWSERVQEKYRTLDRIFEAMKERSDAAGAQLVVVLFPALRQVKTSQSLPGEDLEQPQRRMLELFERHDIPCLDLLPALRNDGGHRNYFPKDQHWNAQGNRLAASEIARFISGLPGCPPP